MSGRLSNIGSSTHGNATTFEFVLRFVAWAAQFSADGPSVRAICDTYDVSRGTAYRWRAAYLDAQRALAGVPVERAA